MAISMEGNLSNLRKPGEEFNDVETRKQKIGGDRNKNSRCKTTMHNIWDKIQCWLFKRLLIIAQWKLWHVLFINTYISISTNSFVSSCTRGRLCFLWPLTVFPAWSRISGLIVTRFDICAGRLLFVLVDDYLCCLRIICAGWYIVSW